MSNEERPGVEQELAQLKKQLGVTDDIVARYAEYEIAYPTSEKEYCDLCGNAIMLITAFSCDPEELPLDRVYFKTEIGEETVLKGLGASEISKSKFGDSKNDYFSNISLWVLPVYLMEDEKGKINLDFKKNRQSFSMSRDPGLLNERNQIYVRKHSQGIVKIAERVDSDILSKFVEREFINPMRTKEQGV